MADWRNTPTISGCLAVAAMLALLSPGVNAVRADDLAATLATADGPTCQADTVVGAEEVLDTLQHMQALAAKDVQARPQAPPETGEIVVLNGRGYNYGPARLQMPSPRELSGGR